MRIDTYSCYSFGTALQRTRPSCHYAGRLRRTSSHASFRRRFARKTSQKHLAGCRAPIPQISARVSTPIPIHRRIRLRLPRARLEVVRGILQTDTFQASQAYEPKTCRGANQTP